MNSGIGNQCNVNGIAKLTCLIDKEKPLKIWFIQREVHEFNSFLESRTVPELHYNSVLCKTDTFSSLKGSLTVTTTAADLEGANRVTGLLSWEN